jgi:ABC-type multidrug transport system ATPase subunit
MPATLQFDGLRRAYGSVRVLEGVSGAARESEVLLVLGRNGSGKSTLLRCLAGLLRPEAGRVELTEDGRTLADSERRRRVGYVAPDVAFAEALTAGETLAFFCRLRRLPAGAGAPLLARLGVPADRAWGALSSGMRQRLRWAWALLHAPAVLLLDEPFQNLDGPGEAIARELLAAHLERGLAVVASPAPIELPHVGGRVELGG